jgi:transcriptional regulator with XRE-family HTH domain
LGVETFGAALKRWREVRQLSVRGLAAKAHYGKSHLSGLENGRLVRPEVAKHLDDVLQAGGELITLAAAEWQARHAGIADIGSGSTSYFATLATRLLSESEGRNDMQRRTFVFGASGMAGLGFTAPSLALETARHGLTLGLAQQRAEAVVDEWQAIVAEYGYSYLATPPAELLELLVVDVLGIQYAIDYQEQAGASNITLRELRSTGALLAALMAMTVANLGDVHQSVRWWRSARQIAVQSGDVETVTWVRGREVVRAIYEQRPLDLILRLVADAEAQAGGAPTRALPELVSGKAQALALAGRGEDAVAALHELAAIHDGLPADESTHRATIFAWADAQLSFTQSFVYSYLGQAREAATAQAHTLAAYPSTYRRGPAQIELQRALCMVRGNDIAGGVRHAQTVIAGLAPSDYIRPIFDLSRRVLDAVPIAQQPHAAVTELRECLTTLDAS